jgi:hypothetical protein
MRVAAALVVGAVVAVAAVLGTRAGSVSLTGPRAAHPLRFHDVAVERGLDLRQGAFRWAVSPDPPAMMGGGLCWLDYDEDGWLDLFVVNSYAEAEAARWNESGGLPRTALYHNLGGHFVPADAGAGADLPVRGEGCVAADLDLDGYTDLYVTTSRANALLWNDGDGTFTEDAVGAGVAAYNWRSGAAVGDVNRDGWPDLFVAGYADLFNPNSAGTSKGFPNTYLGVRDLLFLNNGPSPGGRVTFREVGVQAGLEATGYEYGLGATFTDFDRDGDLDLYVANDTNPNRLYENVPWPGGAQADPDGLGFRFEERAGSAGVADPNAGMGVAVADYDADGRSDIFVTNARLQAHAVYRSQAPGDNEPSFADAKADFGFDSSRGSTGWGASWGDLDLDTDLDLLVANGDVPVTDLVADAEPPQVFENLTAQGFRSRFVERSEQVGLREIGPLLARGSAAADYDNDGDLDVAVAQIGRPLVLLENTVVGGHWLEVQLEGFQPGAEVTAVLPDGRELRREVRAGSSYLSSEDPRCHFGLGQARKVSALVVRWPGGGVTRLTDVPVNQLVAVEDPA